MTRWREGGSEETHIRVQYASNLAFGTRFRDIHHHGRHFLPKSSSRLRFKRLQQFKNEVMIFLDEAPVAALLIQVDHFDLLSVERLVAFLAQGRYSETEVLDDPPSGSSPESERIGRLDRNFQDVE